VDPWSARRAFPSGRGELHRRQEVNSLLVITSAALGVISCVDSQVTWVFAGTALLTAASSWLTPPWCVTCDRLTRLKVTSDSGNPPAWTAVCHRCGSPIIRRFQGPPVAFADLGFLAAALGVTGALAWLVHPLFWALAVVAAAWFMGRDATESSGRN
jgi:hypothetical protein